MSTKEMGRCLFTLPCRTVPPWCVANPFLLYLHSMTRAARRDRAMRRIVKLALQDQVQQISPASPDCWAEWQRIAGSASVVMIPSLSLSPATLSTLTNT